MLNNLDISTSNFSLQPPSPSEGGWELLTAPAATSSGIYVVAKARRGHRIYYLKALSQEHAENALYRKLLRKEFEIGLSLKSPLVMETYSMTNVPDLGDCIVMEYIDGITLREYLDGKQPAVDEALELLRRICEAVAYLHSLQIVHLDLKPSNIMLLRGSNRVKLIDFGFADSPAFADLKGVGGTERYASPELSDANGEFDNRADIYSLGVIMEQMFPRSFRSGRKVAELCRAVDRNVRPADASAVVGLIERSQRQRRIWTVVAICGAVAMVGGFYILTSRHDGDIMGKDAMPQVVEEVKDSVTSRVVTASPDLLSLTDVMDMEPDITTDIPESDTGAVKENDIANDPAGDLIENQIYTQAVKAAEVRWKENLNKIDTLRHQRTLNLCYVGYWRHLAKEDVARWLKTKIPSESPAFGQMMQIAAQTIVNYGENPERQVVLSDRLTKMYKRTGFIGYTQVTVQELPDGRIRKDSLMEDGHYAVEVGYPEHKTAKGIARRLREQEE